MHFSSLVLPLLAAVASAQTADNYAAGVVTVYTDSACKKENQVVTFNKKDIFQCAEFTNTKSQSVKFSTTGFANRGFNVWDSQYCAGDQGGSPFVLGQCLSAADYGLAAWKSAHISPRNTSAQI